MFFLLYSLQQPPLSHKPFILRGYSQSHLSRQVLFCSYSFTEHLVIQWKLSWETTVMRDHLSWRTTSFWQKVTHFNINEPVTKDHLSWETIFLWPMGRSFKTGSTVHVLSLEYHRPRTNLHFAGTCVCNQTLRVSRGCRNHLRSHSNLQVFYVEESDWLVVIDLK